MTTTKKTTKPESDLLQVLCDVASVAGLLTQRLSRHDDVTDELAMARAAEALCLYTLDQHDWGKKQ